MRISNIFEIISTNFAQASYSKPFRASKNPVPNTNIPGKTVDDDRVRQGAKAGFFSQVRPNKNDPHTVTKRSKQPKDPKSKKYLGDPFGEFVEYMAENDVVGNIYFPKVYNFKTITDPHGKEIYKYEIEKLNESTALSKKQVEFLREKIFKEIPKGVDIDNGQDLAQAIGNIVGDYINKGKNTLSRYIKDDELVEAVNQIRHFIRVRNHIEDARQTQFDRAWTSIMYRNTPYGPQLVFADPVFDKKAY